MAAAPGAEAIAQLHADQPFSMLAIDVWDGTPAQVQIFRSNTGWQLPILMNGNAGGITQDYNCTWDYFFVIDQDGFITWRGGPEGADHPTLAAQVQTALDALGTSPAGNTPAVGDRLLGAYPNPFNPQTRIPYDLAEAAGDAAVKLEILDLRGRVLRTLVDGHQPGGTRQEAVWDGTDAGGRKLPSGSYVSRLTVDGGEPQARLLTLIK